VVEVYTQVFEFTTVDGSIVFDFAENKIRLRLLEGEKEFPMPVTLHNFCVVIGGIIYGTNVERKQVFFAGKKGERKVIDLRGFFTKREMGKGKARNTQERF